VKVTELIKKLEELRTEAFQIEKFKVPMGSVPDDAEVVLELWDGNGFHGMTKEISFSTHGNRIELVAWYDKSNDFQT